MNDVEAFGVETPPARDVAGASVAARALSILAVLDAGYRWLSYDYEDGSGFDRFSIDATLHGPYIEFDFKF